jgi:hypothetical protein
VTSFGSPKSSGRNHRWHFGSDSLEVSRSRAWTNALQHCSIAALQHCSKWKVRGMRETIIHWVILDSAQIRRSSSRRGTSDICSCSFAVLVFVAFGCPIQMIWIEIDAWACGQVLQDFTLWKRVPIILLSASHPRKETVMAFSPEVPRVGSDGALCSLSRAKRYKGVLISPDPPIRSTDLPFLDVQPRVLESKAKQRMSQTEILWNCCRDLT